MSGPAMDRKRSILLPTGKVFTIEAGEVWERLDSVGGPATGRRYRVEGITQDIVQFEENEDDAGGGEIGMFIDGWFRRVV